MITVQDPDHHDNVFGGVNRLNRSLQDLDERGLILSLAAFAEDSLGVLLKAFMLSVDATNSLLEGFNAPLGTFSSRIRAAYALGLVTKDQFDDLEHLRKIRNKFSHTWQPISFSDPTITGHIKAINYNYVDDVFPETLIDKVRSSISFLLIELQVAADQITKKGKQVSITGSRLMFPVPGSVDEQIATCRSKLIALNAELANTTGEKHSFLAIVRARWIEKFHLAVALAPKDRLLELDGVFQDFLSKQPRA